MCLHPPTKSMHPLLAANGFHKELWHPVLDELHALWPTGTPFPHIVSADLPGHGDSDIDTRTPFDWWRHGRALLAVRSKVVGLLDDNAGVTFHAVGHSIGGASLALAGLLSPSAFSRYVLIEPIVFPVVSSARGQGLTYMAAAAIRRRDHYLSPQEVVTAYKAKKQVFGRWDPRALDIYAHKGFKQVLAPYTPQPQPKSTSLPFSEASDVEYSGEAPRELCVAAKGAGLWRLKCAPWVEAENFQSGTAHGVCVCVYRVVLYSHVILILVFIPSYAFVLRVVARDPPSRVFGGCGCVR